MYETTSESNVILSLYNSLGELIMTRNEKNLNAGVHSIPFDASQYQNGVYFVDLRIGGNHFKKKIVIAK